MTILEQIQPVLGAILGVAPEVINRETTRSQYANWDSWAHLQLVMELEGQFACHFTMDEVISIASVNDFITLIERKQSPAADTVAGSRLPPSG
jgi:acyl carrier protein